MFKVRYIEYPIPGHVNPKVTWLEVDKDGKVISESATPPDLS